MKKIYFSGHLINSNVRSRDRHSLLPSIIVSFTIKSESIVISDAQVPYRKCVFAKPSIGIIEFLISGSRIFENKFSAL